jgi:hypothetical protein
VAPQSSSGKPGIPAVRFRCPGSHLLDGGLPGRNRRAARVRERAVHSAPNGGRGSSTSTRGWRRRSSGSTSFGARARAPPSWRSCAARSRGCSTRRAPSAVRRAGVDRPRSKSRDPGDQLFDCPGWATPGTLHEAKRGRRRHRPSAAGRKFVRYCGDGYVHRRGRGVAPAPRVCSASIDEPLTGTELDTYAFDIEARRRPRPSGSAASKPAGRGAW